LKKNTVAKTTSRKSTSKVKHADGYISAVVPLFYANCPDPVGRVLTEAALRKIADGDNNYRYDEKLGALLAEVQVSDQLLGTKRGITSMSSSVVDLPPILQQQVKSRRDDIVNDTNILHLDEMVPYTKVWALLHSLLKSQSLRATDLVEALVLVSRVDNHEVTQLVGYDAVNEHAHMLMRQYFCSTPDRLPDFYDDEP
jgi:hypothetical protein